MSNSALRPEPRVEVTPTNPLLYGETLVPKEADGSNHAGTMLKLHKDDEFDGELRLYLDKKLLWSPHTGSQKAHTFHLLEDGSLCIHNEGGEIIWTNGRTHSLPEPLAREDPKLRLVLAAGAAQPMEVRLGTTTAYNAPPPTRIKSATFKVKSTTTPSWPVINSSKDTSLWTGKPLNAGETKTVSWDDVEKGETWDRKTTNTTVFIGIDNTHIVKDRPRLGNNFRFSASGDDYTFTLTETVHKATQKHPHEHSTFDFDISPKPK